MNVITRHRALTVSGFFFFPYGVIYLSVLFDVLMRIPFIYPDFPPWTWWIKISKEMKSTVSFVGLKVIHESDTWNVLPLKLANPSPETQKTWPEMFCRARTPQTVTHARVQDVCRPRRVIALINSPSLIHELRFVTKAQKKELGQQIKPWWAWKTPRQNRQVNWIENRSWIVNWTATSQTFVLGSFHE